MPFTLDPAVGPLLPPVTPPVTPPTISDIPSLRQDFNDTFTPLLSSNYPYNPSIVMSNYTTTSADGHQVPLRLYSKPIGYDDDNDSSNSSSSNPGPAVIFLHGGGYIFGSIDIFDGILQNYVTQSGGIPYISVEYRLAPEHPYPKALEDAYAALEWLHDHAAELGVDPARIAAKGESAGGGLAAALAIYAATREHDGDGGVAGPKIAKQVLVYPMLDHRTTTADKFIRPYLVWDPDTNKMAWEAYLSSLVDNSDGNDDGCVPATASPARLQNATGLPPAYIEVGDLDLFRNEDIAYAQKLLDAGIDVELHVIPGVPHGFEWFAPKSEVALAAIAARVKAVQSI